MFDKNIAKKRIDNLGTETWKCHKKQISQICTEKSVLICEICVKKLKQNFDKLKMILITIQMLF